MRSAVIMLVLALLVVPVASWSAAAATASGTEVRVDVEVNGRRLTQGALVVDDQAYVKLEDVATLLGGRYLPDTELNLAFVLTGNYLDLVADRLTLRNPDLELYHQIANFEEGRGIHYGVLSPHVTVAFIPSGMATAFVQIHADGLQEHEPWFDQQKGDAEWFLAGNGYSQHLFVVDPQLINFSQMPRIIFNGRSLDIAHDAMLWYDNTLYVRLRELAEASGGGVGWDVEQRLATAKIVPGDELTWHALAALNPQIIDHYQRDEAVSPRGAERYVVSGTGLLVEVDEQDRVISIGAAFPIESTPWFPWYDQSLGSPDDVPGVGPAYTQHILVSPDTN